MAYKDEHGGRDSDRTNESLNRPDGGENAVPEGHQTDKETTETTAERIVEGKQSRKPKGLLSRARSLLFGEKTTGDKVKAGFAGWQASGGFQNIIASLSNPKALTALVMGTGIGLFSILGVFNTYKNDGIIKNDPPLRCVQTAVEMPDPPGGGGEDMDVQEVVNIMYDIFCNEFGYTDSDLVGMVACMLVETGGDPDRLESDHVGQLREEKKKFDEIAGPGTQPTTEDAIAAYEAYCEVYEHTNGVIITDGYYNSEGKLRCGIGLIQWTAGRADNFIRGLEKVSLNVSPMDVQYQCAYLIAEAVKHYKPWAPGGERTGNSSDDVATTMFFGTMVYGHMPEPGNEKLAGRLARVAEARAYVDAAVANSEFTMDAVTMYEELSEESYTAKVQAESVALQLCINSTFVVNTDIANAAVSISFLERGDYEDVQGAYGSYRRAARSPNIINDWDWIEGQNRNINSLSTPSTSRTYGDAPRNVSSQPKASWTYYDTDLNTGGGKLDLIACTEYYYFAHLIAFPRETGTSGNAGYFSSCDRGTATAVRIAGADDKFPAGNPLYQLNWAIGAARQGAKHNENARGTQGKGFLWKFSGFMRGSDWYSASGSASISAGTVMISWSVRAANDLLNTAEGYVPGATPEGMLEGEDTDFDNVDELGKDGSVELATLRFPMSRANTTRHIITYVGDATVNSFWGIDWLYQQWKLFDDADRLIRRDLTEEIPEIMSVGLSVKSSFASKSSDQHMTFYMAKAMGAQDNKDLSSWKPANGRMIEFNAKTGLPEFHAWEQIFVRLIHDSDDDASLKAATGNALYEKAEPFQKDGYLDDQEESQLDAEIEQYGSGGNKGFGYTYGNKAFYQDWNSVGEGKVSTADTNNPNSDHSSDYKNITDPTKLLWYDKTDGDETTDPVAGGIGYNWTHESGAEGNPYWRYELVTDIEYRSNQFLRFGLASLMCSLPSEEDADVYQTGEEGNDTGHILGNLYRRYSRIPDRVDSSGRYYYFNTVVSNDMLQDLVQLYVEEKNDWTEGLTYVNNKNERNFGPMYLIPIGRLYSNTMMGTGASSQSWFDRRYGLTADDVDYIMDGIEGNKMGEVNGKEANDSFQRILTQPMHMLSTAQLSLYQNWINSVNVQTNSAHESLHLYNDLEGGEGEPYPTEIYGMNPFLMLEGEDLLEAMDEYNAEEVNWEAGSKSGTAISVRNDIYGLNSNTNSNSSGLTAAGVDPASTNKIMDDRLAWVDRHYYVTESGGIGTFAYQVMALMPSAGSKMAYSTYETQLKNVKTLKAGHTGQANNGNLLGSKGVVQYSDFIYADTTADNKEMAKRLFGKDDRNRDNATQVTGARDDYNRREFILIPYVHTHSQQCDHSQLNKYSHYDVDYNCNPLNNYFCRWQNHVVKNPPIADNLTKSSFAMVDTQVALDGMDGTNYQRDRHTYNCSHQYNDNTDYGDTISFNNPSRVTNRGKYNMNQVMAAIGENYVRYFADTGDEIGWDDKPIIHVECDGWFQYGKCYGGCKCGPLCVCPDCETWYCHACGAKHTCQEYCYHPCSECLEKDYCHDHKECDDAGSRVHGHDGYACKPNCGTANGQFNYTSQDTTHHHLDEGLVDNALHSDKCHYEYGCNALEYLYHNTDNQDGPRKHYRDSLSLPSSGSSGSSSFTASSLVHSNTYEVHNLYMAIPVSRNADISKFDIRDYIDGAVYDSKNQVWISNGRYQQNDAVICDKDNLIQQVSYDMNGWVTYNWQDMIDPSFKGSFRNPDTDGQYVTDVKSNIKGIEKHVHNGSQSQPYMGHPGKEDTGGYNWSSGPGLLQYFTIEGDSIHRDRDTDWQGYLARLRAKYVNAQSEYIEHWRFNGTKEDLIALESIRNRVGYGKTVAGQYISAEPRQRTVSQSAPPNPRWGSAAREVQYERTWGTEEAAAAKVSTGNGIGLGNHGWGEVAVVGTQHPMDPLASEKAGSPNYGLTAAFGGDARASGPDGSKGNAQLGFGSSLLREIIGDEHVFHVKFATQDYAGLTDQNAGDNGRDFMFYVSKEQAKRDLGDNVKPKDYQRVGSSYFNKAIANPDVYGAFRNMDRTDGQYINYYTGELTDCMYSESVYPYASTDNYDRIGNPDAKNPQSRVVDGVTYVYNTKNWPANAGVSVDDGATNGGDSQQKVETWKELDNKKKDSRGGNDPISGAKIHNNQVTSDYRNWVAHASRGTRGMMTQYLNFGIFFKDVYKSGGVGNQDSNNAYMLFEVVPRTDIRLEEDGGRDEYGYPMGSNDADRDKDRWDPENKTEHDDGSVTVHGWISKQEGFVYTSPPGDAILTISELHRAWGYGDKAGFSDTYGQGSNSHWKNMIDLYNAAMSDTRIE